MPETRMEEPPYEEGVARPTQYGDVLQAVRLAATYFMSNVSSIMNIFALFKKNKAVCNQFLQYNLDYYSGKKWLFQLSCMVPYTVVG